LAKFNESKTKDYTSIYDNIYSLNSRNENQAIHEVRLAYLWPKSLNISCYFKLCLYDWSRSKYEMSFSPDFRFEKALMSYMSYMSYDAPKILFYKANPIIQLYGIDSEHTLYIYIYCRVGRESFLHVDLS
jgi:hypothetical protein